jgi:hypothetical protein
MCFVSVLPDNARQASTDRRRPVEPPIDIPPAQHAATLAAPASARWLGRVSPLGLSRRRGAAWFPHITVTASLVSMAAGGLVLAGWAADIQAASAAAMEERAATNSRDSFMRVL